jgi:CDP-diacylglycerol--glycerol-3-phosphate 3-phosphatidyltransferase
MKPQFTVPNVLTGFRIAAIPLVVIVFYFPAPWAHPAAGLIFGLAGITDWLDGYLARRMGQTSTFGAFLDPVADKLIVSTALVVIVQEDPRVIIALIAAVIIGRELTVSALREWMSQIGAREHMAVTGSAKFKTILQMFGLSFMLFSNDFFGLPIYDIGLVLMVVAAILTLWSMLTYVRNALPQLLKADDVA